MDLQTVTTTHGVGDFRWLRSSAGMGHGIPVTIATADLVEATNYPDGALKGGTILALYTSGANSGLYGAHVPDATDGRQTQVCVLLEDVPVRKDADGALVNTRVVGTGLFLPILVDLAQMPQLVDDEGDPHTVLAADLPSNAKAV